MSFEDKYDLLFSGVEVRGILQESVGIPAKEFCCENLWILLHLDWLYFTRIYLDSRKWESKFANENLLRKWESTWILANLPMRMDYWILLEFLPLIFHIFFSECIILSTLCITLTLNFRYYPSPPLHLCFTANHTSLHFITPFQMYIFITIILSKIRYYCWNTPFWYTHYHRYHHIIIF